MVTIRPAHGKPALTDGAEYEVCHEPVERLAEGGLVRLAVACA